MTGEVGKIANCRIVPSKKVGTNAEYYTLTTEEPSDWSTKYKTYFTKSGEEYTAVTGNSAPAWETDKYWWEMTRKGRFMRSRLKFYIWKGIDEKCREN